MQKIIKILSSVFIFIAISLILAILFSFLSYKNIRSLNLNKAFKQVKISQSIVDVYSLASFKLIPSLEAWRSGLNLISKGESLLKELVIYSSDFENQSLNNIRLSWYKVTENYQDFEKYYQQSKILKKYIATEKINKINDLILNIDKVLNYLVLENPKFLVILQNTDEIRATGGFMGSYADLSFNDGVLAPIKISDIYEPDGQFKGFVEAPPGLKEYLSAGKGMRLPDANWHPDFAKSSQQILYYFDEINRDYDGVISINLNVFEEIFKELDNVYLPDLDIYVTSENLAEVLRTDREDFFPGDQRKIDLLSSLFNQVKFKLKDLDFGQKINIFKIIANSSKNKNILFFSKNQDLEKIFIEKDLAGILNPDGIMLLESNVGINKANRLIERKVSFDESVDLPAQAGTQDFASLLNINIDFQNKNTDMNYVNYQRVIMPYLWEVESIDINQEKISNWDSEIIYNFNNQPIKQIGFLVFVPFQEEVDLKINLKADGEIKNLIKQIQPGLLE